MKFLYVIDSSLADTLIQRGYKVIDQFSDIEQKTIWVFEYDPNTFCFDINETSLRRACFVSDNLTMRF